MLKKAMATKTLYVDSRTRVSGSHSDFTISLPEQLNLRDARVRVDGIRTTDTFMTVSERNKYAYFEDGSGGLTWVEQRRACSEKRAHLHVPGSHEQPHPGIRTGDAHRLGRL